MKTHTLLKWIGLGACVTAWAGCDYGNNAIGGSIQFTASGGAQAVNGYDFPPTDGRFVDGWEVRFDRVLVTVDKLTVSGDPESPTPGAVVAEMDGPWAIDLSKQGSAAGKNGDPETAVPISILYDQIGNNGHPFDITKRYGFGYDLVAASASANMLNLDAPAQLDYADMIKSGDAVLYVGTATWKGDDPSNTAGCTTSAPFVAPLPRVVKFKLGFATPATYDRCQNPDFDGAGTNGAAHPGGLNVQAGSQTVAQISLRNDQPFWQSLLQESAAHFDPIAARATCDASGSCTVTTDDLKGQSYTAFTDKTGNPLPWRNCVGAAFSPPPGAQMRFADAIPGVADYRDYVITNQSGQGQLNAGGACTVTRN
jgi:hypothetical protein